MYLIISTLFLFMCNAFDGVMYTPNNFPSDAFSFDEIGLIVSKHKLMKLGRRDTPFLPKLNDLHGFVVSEHAIM